MAYFTKDFLSFFKELEKNNSKEWFDLNRKRYEEHVKNPFKLFIQDVIDEVGKVDDNINITPNEASFRINRDIRFAKDKTPYKTNRSAIISPSGKKDKSTPGLYLDLSVEEFRIYGGAYMASTEQIHRVREEISFNMKKFQELKNNPDFVESYGEILGEKAKRIPKELREAAEKEPLIYNKQWYYFAKLKPDTILKDQLLDIIMAHYIIAKPVMDFFKRPIVG